VIVACFARLKQPVRHFGVSEIPNGLEAARNEQTATANVCCQWQPVCEPEEWKLRDGD